MGLVEQFFLGRARDECALVLGAGEGSGVCVVCVSRRAIGGRRSWIQEKMMRVTILPGSGDSSGNGVGAGVEARGSERVCQGITLVRPGPLHRCTAGGDGAGCDDGTHIVLEAGLISGGPAYVNDVEERLVGDRHRSACGLRRGWIRRLGGWDGEECRTSG